MKRIVVVPGDGIGREVVPVALSVLKELDKRFQLDLHFDFKDWSAESWLRTKQGVTKDDIKELQENYHAIFFGALGDPRIPDMAHGRAILLALRTGLDLYINTRPVKLINSKYCPLKDKQENDIDLLIIRENTQDIYLGVGGYVARGLPEEIAMDQSVHTRKGVERIIRYAFASARTREKKKVTLCHKANAIIYGGGLWQRVFRHVALEFPQIIAEECHVDVMAMELVRNPEKFSVIVASNLFGDIISDLGAGIVGGLGLAASANINPTGLALFEPVHGSAPDIAGKNQANPCAALLTASMMLEYFGSYQAARCISDAVKATLQEGIVTPDLNGKATTKQVADFVMMQLKNL